MRTTTQRPDTRSTNITADRAHPSNQPTLREAAHSDAVAAAKSVYMVVYTKQCNH